MPNRGTPQDQQQTGRRNPIQTTPDDDEELEAGDPALMEEAGNLRPRNTQQAAVVGETDIEDEEAEGDEDEDETEGDEEPVGGRV
ncbi:MAG: hypothetical protein H7Y89_09095 [Steroidobacteraceae bacterium]|nr:hypothetical protein [Steroidobacteraceae bacterium]